MVRKDQSTIESSIKDQNLSVIALFTVFLFLMRLVVSKRGRTTTVKPHNLDFL